MMLASNVCENQGEDWNENKKHKSIFSSDNLGIDAAGHDKHSAPAGGGGGGGGFVWWQPRQFNILDL